MQFQQQYPLTITARNQFGQATQQIQLQAVCNGVPSGGGPNGANQPPAFQPATVNAFIQAQQCQSGGTLQPPLRAIDPDAQQQQQGGGVQQTPLQYQITSGNQNNQFRIDQTGAIQFTPFNQEPTQQQVQLTVTARDSQGATGTGQVTIDVSACVNTPPVVRDPAPQFTLRDCGGNSAGGGVGGGNVVGRISAFDNENDPLTYTIVNGGTGTGTGVGGVGGTPGTFQVSPDGLVIDNNLLYYEVMAH